MEAGDTLVAPAGVMHNAVSIGDVDAGGAERQQ